MCGVCFALARLCAHARATRIFAARCELEFVCSGRAARCHAKGDVAGTTAQIQRTVAGSYGGHFDHAPFPAPVQAETLQVVDQVVTRRNRGKEIVHLCRTPFAGTVEWICHAGPHRPVSGHACSTNGQRNATRNSLKQTGSKARCAHVAEFGKLLPAGCRICLSSDRCRKLRP